MRDGSRLGHGRLRPGQPTPPCGGEVCAGCRIEDRLRRLHPEADWWEVRGEGLVRGMVFAPDYWIYVLLRERDSRSIRATGEFIDAGEDAERHVIRTLLGDEVSYR